MQSSREYGGSSAFLPRPRVSDSVVSAQASPFLKGEKTRLPGNRIRRMIRPDVLGKQRKVVMVGCDKSPRLTRLAWLVLTLACSSSPKISARDAADANDVGAVVPARTPGERLVLTALPELSTGTAKHLGSETVVAGSAYEAASGRTCRAIRIANDLKPNSWRERLACQDAQGWFFVPDVFGTDDSGKVE